MPLHAESQFKNSMVALVNSEPPAAGVFHGFSEEKGNKIFFCSYCLDMPQSWAFHRVAESHLILVSTSSSTLHFAAQQGSIFSLSAVGHFRQKRIKQAHTDLSAACN